MALASKQRFTRLDKRMFVWKSKRPEDKKTGERMEGHQHKCQDPGGWRLAN